MTALRSSSRSLGIRALLLAVGVAGCNSILDNKEGQLKQSASPTDVAKTDPTDPGTGDTTTPPAPTAPTAAGCQFGTSLCGGLCAAHSDPAFGCGAASCAPCAITHGTAGCNPSGACTVGVCDKGYADCDGKPENGCEVDLSKATSCGSCNAVCNAAAPNCAPSGDSFACSTGCTPTAPLLCGTECVDPLASNNHCGGCGVACPVVPNGQSTCSLATCTTTCHPDSHLCGGACVAANDAAACGATCTVCPVPANGTPTCTADTCGFTCTTGFADCDGSPATGCETNILTDLANCGSCGAPCNGTCTNGTCTPAAPDAGAPPPAGP